MKRSTIRLVIFIASLLLSALIVVQIMWVMRAYQLQETQVNYDITQTLVSVSKEIQAATNDSSYLIDPVNQIDETTFIVKTNQSLDPYYAEQVLTREFKKREINLDFEYNLYNCFNDSVIYTQAIYINESKVVEKEKPSVEVSWESEDGHYFSIYFPNKSDIVLGRLKFWLYSSLLLVIIILFFAYTISIILKQKRLSEIKSDFINNMTHELKTPISTIALSSEVLMKPNISENPEKLKNYAQIINRENLRMQNQVEKVLQIASLEKDKVELTKTYVNLNKLIEDVIATFTPLIEDRKGEIHFDSAAKNPTVHIDEIHISNVITNLIDNALKYSKDSPTVSIVTKNEKENIVVSIKDNGIGMKKDVAGLVFDKFYRVPTGNIHNVKGFGLGLHYVKVMTEEHGGKIEVNSVVNEGSTFTLTLPNSN